MSRSSWRAILESRWKLLKESKPDPRLAVIGIGNELWGDDAAGVMLARRLNAKDLSFDGLLIIDAGPAPENYSGQIRRFRPDFVLLIDAMRPGSPVAAPGRIKWIEISDLDGVSALTHGMPLSVLGEFLRAQLGCSIGLLGIEGAVFTLAEDLSLPVKASVKKILRELTALFSAE
ncbi:MAG TPA: hydrogenase maturation protease [Anaerolineaceae bacterium]|nr:hydrogenase maturation protease [Anaerolineaceae bacterium]